ncbi:hypothetical protein AAFP30_20380 [Gordonia sp. CPCC 205515]|uniref:hypothetical protein n=1 Tax=Gordonia sp. CPCC 205515 TaxID=3140791 RepID=UPI003AF339F5
MNAIALTVLDPAFDVTYGGRRYRVRIVDEVVVETTAFIDGEVEQFSKAFPLCGAGVIRNGDAGPTPVGLITDRQRRRFTKGSE